MTPERAASLTALAEHLAPDLAHELRRLVDADSRAHLVADLEDRTQRAEDLAAELRRQLQARDRLVDLLAPLREAAHDARVDAVAHGTGFVRLRRGLDGVVGYQRLDPADIVLVDDTVEKMRGLIARTGAPYPVDQSPPPTPARCGCSTVPVGYHPVDQ